MFVAGAVVGVLLWGAFNWAMELSNTGDFCVSCHEMRNTVYKELQETVHFTNRTGVRATCSDCHVPKEWHYKLMRKIQATSTSCPTKIMGTIDTPEKFEAQRLALANHVWATDEGERLARMPQLSFGQAMDLAKQSRPAQRMHRTAWKRDRPASSATDIAHNLPAGWDVR